MSLKKVTVLLFLGLAFSVAPSLTQGQESGKIFKLLRDTESVAIELDLEAEKDLLWEKAIGGRSLELSFALGFLDLNTTLLAHEQIIYKYSNEFTYWGDVELKGESAFAPVFRLGYTLSKWLAIEGNASVSLSEYNSTITNAKSRKNEPGAPINTDVVLGEFDAEHRSLITFLGGGNLLLYPLNIAGDGKGFLQPFLTGGFGRIWYDINSQYSAGAVSTNNVNFGAGLRLLGDETISLRFEFLYHKNTVQFDPAEYFQVLDEGTTLILLEEHPTIDLVRVDRVVETFEPQVIKSLNWSIGIQGSF